MAFVAPFKGLRYNSSKAGALEDLVTPPYDVINSNAEKALTGRNPYNIIRLDITKDPGLDKIKDPARYTGSATLLSNWFEQGILVREQQDAFYLYDIVYRLPNGTKRVRRGFICLVRLAEFDERIVKPHEQIFESVIQDRLELTRHCRAQFSQVFSLYSDSENNVIETLEKTKGQPIASASDADGCLHTLWKITDRTTLETVHNLFEDKSLYIADGHHRYTTALAYRNELQAVSKEFHAERPENHIMMYLCPMEDKGLSILPTHRMVKFPGKIGMTELFGRLEEYFHVRELHGGSRETLISDLLARMDEASVSGSPKSVSTFGLYHSREDRSFVLDYRNRESDAVTGEHPCLRELDVVILSKQIIEGVLELDHHQCEYDNLVTFHSDIGEALDIAVKDSALDEESTPLLFLMNPTRVEQVQCVADEGLIMPHKSTYFYPKILTGLVLHKFD